MAKPPRWLAVSAPYAEGDKVFVNFRIRARHPTFLWMMWGLFRREIRQRGHNPNSPRMLWLTVYHLVRILVKQVL